MVFMISIFIAVIVVLVCCFISYMNDINGWEDLKYCEGSWKVLMQKNGSLEKDAEYIAFMRDVYFPNRKKARIKREENEIMEKTLDRFLRAVERDESYLYFDYNSEFFTKEEIVQKALEYIHKMGCPNAREEKYKGQDYWNIRIYIGEPKE